MFENVEDFKKYIRTKKVAVLGIGISNIPLIRYLSNIGVKITAFDKSDAKKIEPLLVDFQGLNVEYSLGEDYLNNLKGFDVIFRTPGMRFDLPELVLAKENGAVLTSEMEVFFDICHAEIFAVTGSDGKTTTTTIIYNMLKEQGYKCWLGGNIGTPLLSKIEEIKETDKVILELSSFQLHTLKKSPHIAVITNLSPNHLDVHKSMEEYIEAKKNIFIYQSPKDKLILNYDNAITKSFISEAKGKVEYFSRQTALNDGALLKDGYLIYKQGSEEIEIVKADEIILPGDHNIENYLAAISAVIGYVKPETMQKVARTFAGVEHRIELVRELEGVKFYNDSIASSPSRTIAGLKAFNQKVILIAGGKDKNIPYDDMGEILVDRVKLLVLIGATAPKIEKALNDYVKKSGNKKSVPIIKCNTYEEVVARSFENAHKGDIIILSPASTSFDMFKNFEERGRKYKEIVMNL